MSAISRRNLLSSACSVGSVFVLGRAGFVSLGGTLLGAFLPAISANAVAPAAIIFELLGLVSSLSKFHDRFVGARERAELVRKINKGIQEIAESQEQTIEALGNLKIVLREELREAFHGRDRSEFAALAVEFKTREEAGALKGDQEWLLKAAHRANVLVDRLEKYNVAALPIYTAAVGLQYVAHELLGAPTERFKEIARQHVEPLRRWITPNDKDSMVEAQLEAAAEAVALEKFLNEKRSFMLIDTWLISNPSENIWEYDIRNPIMIFEGLDIERKPKLKVLLNEHKYTWSPDSRDSVPERYYFNNRYTGHFAYVNKLILPWPSEELEKLNSRFEEQSSYVRGDGHVFDEYINKSADIILKYYERSAADLGVAVTANRELAQLKVAVAKFAKSEEKAAGIASGKKASLELNRSILICASQCVQLT
jgi:hypothetical protein